MLTSRKEETHQRGGGGKEQEGVLAVSHGALKTHGYINPSTFFLRSHIFSTHTFNTHAVRTQTDDELFVRGGMSQQPVIQIFKLMNEANLPNTKIRY